MEGKNYTLFFLFHKRKLEILKILFKYSRRISYVYFLIQRAQEKLLLAFLICL